MRASMRLPGTILMIVRTRGRMKLCSCCGMPFGGLSLRSMRHPLLVAILIVSLLTCPLRCFACETHAMPSAVSSCASCECCKHCEEVPASNPIPFPESDECLCNSCICDGAVVESPAGLPDLGPGLIWMLPLRLESHVQFGISQFADPAAVKHVGQTLSGRGARLAYQSWQI